MVIWFADHQHYEGVFTVQIFVSVSLGVVGNHLDVTAAAASCYVLVLRHEERRN
jgi:hypothetical protein